MIGGAIAVFSLLFIFNVGTVQAGDYSCYAEGQAATCWNDYWCWAPSCSQECSGATTVKLCAFCVHASWGCVYGGWWPPIPVCWWICYQQDPVCTYINCADRNYVGDPDYFCKGTELWYRHWREDWSCSGGACQVNAYGEEFRVEYCPYCCSGDSCTGVCPAGQTQSQPCGNCGTQTKTCQSDCQWGSYGSCTGQGECSPGSTKTEGSCGNCGTKSYKCSSSCSWVYQVCVNQGVCSPGQTQSQSCGNCGTQTKTCQSNCQWGSWGSCVEGVCSPGQTESCGSCGTKICKSNCTWDLSDCNNCPNAPQLQAPPSNVWINYNPTLKL